VKTQIQWCSNFAGSRLEYKILKVCHVVFLATDWCTNAHKWDSLGTQAERAKVQKWMESRFTIANQKISGQPKQTDYSVLEVFIEMAMCLVVMGSAVVTNAVLPQVNIFVCITLVDLISLPFFPQIAPEAMVIETIVSAPRRKKSTVRAHVLILLCFWDTIVKVN
jgi:hypothetical protein